MLALLSGVLCNKFENIELSNVERTVNLAGPYATEVVKLTLHANEDHISHLSYLIPLDYDAKIARIFFVKSGKDKNSLPFARSVYIYVSLKLARTEDLSHTTASSFHSTSTLTKRSM